MNNSTTSLDELKKAVRRNPKNADLHHELGRALYSAGRLSEAIRVLKKAVRIHPVSALRYSDLGAILKQSGDAEQAKETLAKALELDEGLAIANYNMGMIFADDERFSEALPFLRRAKQQAPDQIQYVIDFNKVLGNVVPRWHFPMMNDVARNEAYQKAIEAVVHEGMHVLEIGTGSGLLSMMAVRAGARHVTTCEVVPEIAEQARKVISDNGMSDRITVISKDSKDLVVGRDLSEPADVLLSEILGTHFLGEGVLTSIDHARRNLVKPGAAMIPSGGAILAALADKSGAEDQIRVGSSVNGFDLSAFNALAPMMVKVDRHLKPSPISDPVRVYDFDFSDRFSIESQKSIPFAASRNGTAVGVLQWMEIRLTDDVVFDNAPPEGLTSHWPVHLYKFPRPVEVTEGEAVTVKAGTNGAVVWFWQE